MYIYQICIFIKIHSLPSILVLKCLRQTEFFVYKNHNDKINVFQKYIFGLISFYKYVLPIPFVGCSIKVC